MVTIMTKGTLMTYIDNIDDHRNGQLRLYQYRQSSFPFPWFLAVSIVRVAWRMPLVEQHLFCLWVTGIQLPEFSQIIVIHSMNLMSSVLSTIVCCYLWLFSWPLQYIAVHRITASDYPFGYFQTFLYQR